MTYVIRDVICPHCNACRDLDLCRDPDLQVHAAPFNGAFRAQWWGPPCFAQPICLILSSQTKGLAGYHCGYKLGVGHSYMGGWNKSLGET